MDYLTAKDRANQATIDEAIHFFEQRCEGEWHQKMNAAGDLTNHCDFEAEKRFRERLVSRGCERVIDVKGQKVYPWSKNGISLVSEEGRRKYPTEARWIEDFESARSVLRWLRGEIYLSGTPDEPKMAAVDGFLAGVAYAEAWRTERLVNRARSSDGNQQKRVNALREAEQSLAAVSGKAPLRFLAVEIGERAARDHPELFPDYTKRFSVKTISNLVSEMRRQNRVAP